MSDRGWMSHGLGLLALASALVLAIMVAPNLLEPAAGLRDAVSSALSGTRVANPVTAVLLDFRGYDTLLELAVLLLAWLGVQAVRSSTMVSAPEPAPEAAAESLVRILLGPMILVAGYLLWAGADHPGGALQAGAVGAAAFVAWRVVARSPPSARLGSAWLAAAGLAAFIAVGTLVMIETGRFLDYPLAWVRELMMAIEVATALSVASILAGLFDAVLDPSAGPR